MVDTWEIRIVGFFLFSDTDGLVSHFWKVAVDPFQTFQMTLAWRSTETRHSHCSSKDIKLPKWNVYEMTIGNQACFVCLPSCLTSKTRWTRIFRRLCMVAFVNECHVLIDLMKLKRNSILPKGCSCSSNLSVLLDHKYEELQNHTCSEVTCWRSGGA